MINQISRYGHSELFEHSVDDKIWKTICGDYRNIFIIDSGIRIFIRRIVNLALIDISLAKGLK